MQAVLLQLLFSKGEGLTKERRSKFPYSKRKYVFQMFHKFYAMLKIFERSILFTWFIRNYKIQTPLLCVLNIPILQNDFPDNEPFRGYFFFVFLLF